MRKHYIDNLRWIILLILIPYHVSMAWNAWGEPNYIFFEGNRVISSIIVFFSPYFMPLPFLSELLSIGGKSLVEYLYLFLLGYYVFSSEKIVNKAEKNCWLLFGIGFVATVLNVYLFLWFENEYTLLNTIAKYVSEWVVIIALIGLAKRYWNFSGKISDYMNQRSFLFYIYHFIWVVLFQYILYGLIGKHTVVLFIGSVILAYLATFISCEISIRIPFMCFLTGAKYKSKK